MSLVDFDQVIESIPSFTSKELKELQSMTSFFLSGNTDTDNPTRPNENEKEILHALAQSLGSEGIQLNMSYQLISRVSGWKKKVREVNDFVGYFENRSRVYLKDIERKVLMKLTFNFLIKDMKDRNIPITPKSLISNLGRLSDLFDKAFPGYMKSGLAYLVIRNNIKARKRIKTYA